jgi:nucleotide-binding universal stress UspA family protein
MGVLRVLCSQGDAVYTWDAEKAETGDPGAREAVEEAERIIREAQARGAVAFKTVPGQPAERVRGFDPNADEIIVVPRIAGG